MAVAKIKLLLRTKLKPHSLYYLDKLIGCQSLLVFSPKTLNMVTKHDIDNKCSL